MPLYTFKGEKPLATKANGIGGMWHVIKLSKSNIAGGLIIARRRLHRSRAGRPDGPGTFVSGSPRGPGRAS